MRSALNSCLPSRVHVLVAPGAAVSCFVAQTASLIAPRLVIDGFVNESDFAHTTDAPSSATVPASVIGDYLMVGIDPQPGWGLASDSVDPTGSATPPGLFDSADNTPASVRGEPVFSRTSNLFLAPHSNQTLK